MARPEARRSHLRRQPGEGPGPEMSGRRRGSAWAAAPERRSELKDRREGVRPQQDERDQADAKAHQPGQEDEFTC